MSYYKDPEEMSAQERWDKFSKLLGIALAEAWLEGRYNPEPKSEAGELVPEEGPE
ncbi:hypothetical protein AB0O34_32205 [Sphaerisporangium sp. NPDC088356]|uniref:hypothetical protein n=1 Tax=Sphaerisporangium sp. NPDC088356 TaxID=3154871 RepID=UPI00343C27B6